MGKHASVDTTIWRGREAIPPIRGVAAMTMLHLLTVDIGCLSLLFQGLILSEARQKMTRISVIVRLHCRSRIPVDIPGKTAGPSPDGINCVVALWHAGGWRMILVLHNSSAAHGSKSALFASQPSLSLLRDVTAIGWTSRDLGGLFVAFLSVCVIAPWRAERSILCTLIVPSWMYE